MCRAEGNAGGGPLMEEILVTLYSPDGRVARLPDECEIEELARRVPAMHAWTCGCRKRLIRAGSLVLIACDPAADERPFDGGFRSSARAAPISKEPNRAG
jgi:hypothetical protein